MYFLIATILFSSKGGNIAVAANSLLLSNILVLAGNQENMKKAFTSTYTLLQMLTGGIKTQTLRLKRVG